MDPPCPVSHNVFEPVFNDDEGEEDEEEKDDDEEEDDDDDGQGVPEQDIVTLSASKSWPPPCMGDTAVGVCVCVCVCVHKGFHATVDKSVC